MHKKLAELVGEELLLRCKETHCSTDQKSLTLNELAQIKFSFQLFLCLLKYLVTLLLLKSLDKAFQETYRLIFLVKTKIFNQVLKQVSSSFWIIF